MFPVSVPAHTQLVISQQHSQSGTSWVHGGAHRWGSCDPAASCTCTLVTVAELWLDSPSLWVGSQLNKNCRRVLTGSEDPVLLTVQCSDPGLQLGPRTPYGSRSRPAGGDTWPGHPGTAARPPPAALGTEPETRWGAAAAEGHAGSHTGRRAGWRHTGQWGWSGNFYL